MKKYMVMALTVMALMGCSKSDELSMEGKIAMKGSMPHTYLVIEDKQSHKDYKIQNSQSFNLMHRQKEIIKIKAKLLKKAVGPGFPAVIEVLEVQ